jgi:hypothetical protein
MIRVVPKPEPSDFDAKVRQPGRAFLQGQGVIAGQTTPANFPWKELWRSALEDLFDDYGEICAYSGMRIPSCRSGATVDHFLHKGRNPFLAYEWNNYRLAFSRFNSRKSSFDDVLDPFQVEPGWFVIDFGDGRVLANPLVERSIEERIKQTIQRLKLNERRLKNKRTELFDRFLKKKVELGVLCEDAPFVYQEILRQGLDAI